MTLTPEQQAREHIDVALEAAGWVVQDRAGMNLAAGPGVAVREYPMASGHGRADYLLFVQGKAVGVLEAKPAGYTLTNVELQADKYASGLPAGLNPPVNPLPFLYMSTGVETRFINGLDPEPKTRAISANLAHIHRPATLGDWITAETLDEWVKRLHAEAGGLHTSADDTRPSAVSVPPLAEWSRICVEVHRHISMIEELERDTARDLARCGRLRQGVLEWASEGRLVDQDPNDERAGALLGRIKAEEETTAQTTRKKVGKGRTRAKRTKA